MKKLLTITALAFTATMAQARIGWTFQECVRQYGKYEKQLTKGASARSGWAAANWFCSEGFRRAGGERLAGI